MPRFFAPNRSVEIEKAKNGWVVRIRRPSISAPEQFQKQQLKTIARIIALLSKISGQEAVRGADEELEPWKESGADLSKMMEEVDQIIDELFKKEGPLPLGPEQFEREEEIYVFNSLDEAINFSRKFLES